MPRHFAKKKWGQNFLADTNLLRKIIRTINPQPEDRIFEIGPGEGALTEHIIPMVDKVAAIEIDPALVEHLKSVDELNHCHFIHGDVLWYDLKNLPFPRPVRIIGNIPYNITSPILFWLIEQRDYWSDAYIMVQKELSDRLTGAVGTKAYGRLTVMVGAMLDVSACFTIPPEVFIPRPQVQSAIIQITKKAEPLVPDDKVQRFERIVKAAFEKRRKMLQNSLKGFNIDKAIQDKIDFTRRPETLTIQEFAELV
jgi:16S rRNA (adenine1518-N6/adenine1519-N6)-dimethyltransferase